MTAILKPFVSNGEVVLRIALAAVLGGVVGFERELNDQPAGLRTHISVALGAVLFGLISTHGFDRYVSPRNDTDYQIDVTRVASQVVVGIGFLGAGAILKEGPTIRGLTTAASLWVTAAIGLAAGIGNYFAAGVTTAALLVGLIGLRAPRRALKRRLGTSRDVALVRLRPGADPSGVVDALLGIAALEVDSLSIRRREDAVVVEADVRSQRGVEAATLLSGIAERDDVESINMA